MSKKSLGTLGEKIALKYYLDRGFEFLTKNYLTRYGELDLIMSKDGLLYGIEVKTRRNHRYGYAEEMINRTKIKKMAKSSYLFAPWADWQLEIMVIYLQQNTAKIKRFPINDYWLICQNTVEYVC